MMSLSWPSSTVASRISPRSAPIAAMQSSSIRRSPSNGSSPRGPPLARICALRDSVFIAPPRSNELSGRAALAPRVKLPDLVIRPGEIAAIGVPRVILGRRLKRHALAGEFRIAGVELVRRWDLHGDTGLVRAGPPYIRDPDMATNVIDLPQ